MGGQHRCELGSLQVRITKREGELKSAFGAELRRQQPSFVTLLHVSAGAPDRSITGNGRTTMWEYKHGTPEFESPGLQELMCMRLEANGYCRYVVWQEGTTEGPRTLIVKPSQVHHRLGWRLEAEAWCPGFNHHWLVACVAKVHNL